MLKEYKGDFAILNKIQKPLIFQNLKIPMPNDHQLLVKIKYTYICGTQLNEINGKKGNDKYLPHVLGHEASGVVLETGKQVKKFKPGDNVILSWIKKNGHESENPFYLNSKKKIINSGQVSTFSQLSLVSKTRVYKLLKGMPMDIAALFGCAIPTGFGIVFKYIKKIKKNEFVGIYGVGGVGMMSIIALKLLGISNIYAIDKNKNNLKIAKKFGCKKIYTPHVFSKEIINSKINKKLIKYNIEISGDKKMMEMATKNLSSKGSCILAGNVKYGFKINLNPYELIFGKKIFGFSGSDLPLDKNFKKYYQLIKKINYNKLRKVFKVYKFKKINQAIADFKNGKTLRPLIKF